jgi:uncharacterized Rossmann fold enzyme
VEYSRWVPYYRRIADEFRFPFEAEESAALELLGLLPPEAREAPAERLRARLVDREVVVVGLAPEAGAPPLSRLPSTPRSPAVVAADGATERCLAAGIVPEIVVTDLDGPVPAEVAANARGSLVLIHAHGDNRPALRTWVPQFPGALAGSWAGAPRTGLVNFGGFTDGDRGAFLAEASRASRVLLFGFDFHRVTETDPVSEARKRSKLRWAERLIGLLAQEGGVPLVWWHPDGTQEPVQAGDASAEETGPSTQ